MMTREQIELLCRNIQACTGDWKPEGSILLKHDAEQRQIIDEQVEENRGLRSDVHVMQAANASQRQRIEEMEEWKRIVLGTGTDQEAVIRMAAYEYTKVAAQAWKEKFAHLEQQNAAQRELLDKQAKEIDQYKGVAESWRNIHQEEMCYTMREVEALGIDFNESVISAGRALWDVCMERIAELRKAEHQNAALREALTNLHALVKGECPSLLNEDSGGDAQLAMQIEQTLKEHP